MRENRENSAQKIENYFESGSTFNLQSWPNLKAEFMV